MCVLRRFIPISLVNNLCRGAKSAQLMSYPFSASRLFQGANRCPYPKDHGCSKEDECSSRVLGSWTTSAGALRPQIRAFAQTLTESKVWARVWASPPRNKKAPRYGALRSDSGGRTVLSGARHLTTTRPPPPSDSVPRLLHRLGRTRILSEPLLKNKKPGARPGFLCVWRRDRDSNPGKAFTFAGFQDRCIQPLCHPSTAGNITGNPCRVNGVDAQSSDNSTARLIRYSAASAAS